MTDTGLLLRVPGSTVVSTPLEGLVGGQSPIGLPGAPSTSVVELGKQLLLASRDGNADEIRTLVGKGAPFTTDWLGTSPLHLAAQYGHVEACQRLLECGISKDARTKVDKTPLHVAAFYGHSDVMETLLKKGCDVNAVDMLYMTPLHWAVERCDPLAVETLLRYGAEVNLESKFDKTPMEIASDKARPDIFEMLQNPEPYRIHHPPLDPHVSDPVTMAATDSITNHDEDMSEVDAVMKQQGFSTPSGELGTSERMRLFEAHGIALLPEDNASDAPLATFMRNSNQRLALTDAGKLALASSASKKQQTVTVVSKAGVGVGSPSTTTKPLGAATTAKIITLGGGSGGGLTIAKTGATKLTGLGAKGSSPKVIKITQAQLESMKAANGGKLNGIIASSGLGKQLTIKPAATALSGLPGHGGGSGKIIKVLRVKTEDGGHQNIVSKVVLPTSAPSAVPLPSTAKTIEGGDAADLKNQLEACRKELQKQKEEIRQLKEENATLREKLKA